MMEVKDVIEYLNNEGFDTFVNDYDVIFVDVKQYGMENKIIIDLCNKDIVCETPIHEEVDNKIVKPLTLLLGLNLIDYPSGRYTPLLTKRIWHTNAKEERELLDLIYKEIEKDHEEQD